MKSGPISQSQNTVRCETLVVWSISDRGAHPTQYRPSHPGQPTSPHQVGRTPPRAPACELKNGLWGLNGWKRKSKRKNFMAWDNSMEFTFQHLQISRVAGPDFVRSCLWATGAGRSGCSRVCGPHDLRRCPRGPQQKALTPAQTGTGEQSPDGSSTPRTQPFWKHFAAT